ncbi:MAG: FCD domain-containing protein [Planctomycetes bacterium]|nr:FCD domain-containing protein [Planctomycetota bacterium]
MITNTAMPRGGHLEKEAMENNVVRFGPVSKELLHTKIADAINAYVRDNGIMAGEKLPSERDMAEMFQTSRNSVREALRVLENQGAVEVRIGRGVFVREKPDGDGSILVELVKSNFRELHELKSVLESDAVRKVAAGASAEEKEALLECARTMEKLAKQGEYRDEVDHRFHMTLLEIAGNRAITLIIDKVRLEVLGEYWGYLDYDRSVWLETVPHHMRVARAIARGDGERAMREMERINQHSLAVLVAADGKRP